MSIKLDTKAFLLKHFSTIASYRFKVIKFYKSVFKFLQYLPGNSTIIGPPRGIYRNVTAYNDSNPHVKIQEVKFAEKKHYVRKSPVTNSKLVQTKFDNLLSAYTVEKIVYFLSNARYLYGNGGTIITSDDKIFLPASPLKNEWNYKMHQSLYLLKLPKIANYKKVIVVDTRGCEDNYFHWVKDHIARFYWIKQLDLNLEEYTIVCNHGSAKYNSYSFECLRQNGFNFKQWINVDDVKHVYAEELIVLPYSNKGFNMDTTTFYKPEALFLKDLFQSKATIIETYDRIYISRRRSSRSSPQELQLITQLEKYNVKEIFIEDYNSSEAFELFSNARLVIGLHGAGLTGIMFCKKDTVIIEIFGPNFIVTDYWSLSNQFELNYHAYCNDEMNKNVKEHRVARLTPTEIKVDEFMNFFKKIVVV